jgi:hypothetical protein
MLGWDHCQVHDAFYEPPGEVVSYEHAQLGEWHRITRKGQYDREAQTTLKLSTGGRKAVQRNNLFAFQGEAFEILNRKALPPYDPPTKRPIPNEQVTIGALGTLGADGRLYKALPDNATYDVTPKVSMDFYAFSLNQQKHTLHIAANDQPLANDRVAPNAKFCVGQKINLTSYMMPSIDAVVSDIQAQWFPPNLFVNYIENWPHGAKKYLREWNLLLAKDTSLWWVNGGEKSPRCDWTLAFSNGQTAKIAANGKMHVHRPAVVAFTPVPPFYATISEEKHTMGRPWLLLGDESGVDGSMNFSVQVYSLFHGTIRWTQLINQYRYRDEVTGFWTKNTGGEYWADGGEFYVPDVLSTEIPADSTGLLPFGDGPGNPVGISTVTAVDTFKTYLRFRPFGEDNIWVTLRLVEWSWDAQATNPRGLPYCDIPSSWTITRSIIPGPTCADETEFPFWPNVTSSIGE